MHARRPRPIIVFLIAITCAFQGAEADATRTFRSKHYDVVTDTDRATASEIAVYMDSVYAEYDERLSAFKAQREQASTLYLFETERAYLAFLQSVGYDARNTAGVFFSKQGETGLATYLSGQPREQMLSTLRHEGFHQFAHARIGRNLPIWANEGLAEYFGYGVPVRGRLRVGFAPAAPIERVRLAVENKYWYSFDEMLSMSNERWGDLVREGGPNAGLLYDQAWLMAHFLAHGEGGRYAAAFENYLSLVAAGKPSLDSFAEAFGSAETAPFEKAWVNWLRKATPDPISTAGERVEFIMRGMRLLAERGVRVETIGDVKRELRRREFVLRTSSHGVERVTSSLDDHVFTPPRDAGGRLAYIEIVPAADAHSVPTVRIVGLELDVVGIWRRDPQGELAVEIAYR